LEDRSFYEDWEKDEGVEREVTDSHIIVVIVGIIS